MEAAAAEVAPECVDVFVTDLHYSGRTMDATWWGEVMVFGRRADGRSVRVVVLGFRAYFYCLAPPDAEEAGFDATGCALVDELKHALLEKSEAVGSWQGQRIQSIEIRAEHVRRTPVMHYSEECDMYRVSCSHPQAITTLRDRIVETGVELPSAGAVPPRAFEANFDYILRFMVDTGVRHGTWMRVTHFTEESDKSMCASPDLMCASAHSLTPFTDEEEMSSSLDSKVVLLSFDIECRTTKNAFPDPDKKDDQVIQICADTTVIDSRSVAEVESEATMALFALNSVSRKVAGRDIAVNCFKTENDLLVAFARWVRVECDPDVITSWNGPNFDWKYLIRRAEVLQCAEAANQFSRLVKYQSRNREVKKSTRAYGSTKDNEARIPGRTIFDMLLPVRKNYKLRSYKLNAVSEKFLEESKDDVKPSEITGLFMGSPQDRGKLAHYCAQDARLPRRLLLKMQMLRQYTEIARVCRVPLTYLCTRGEQIKVFTQLCYAAQKLGFVVDYVAHSNAAKAAAAADGTDKGYEGATVLDPIRGFYPCPIATLDFSSLYPSIMQAHNLCFTAYVPPERVHEFAPEDVETSPTGDTFVRAHVRKGLLPQILDELLGARRVAKKLMAEAEERGDTFNHLVYDKRQLALKVSANSVYGFTGVKMGKLPLQAIARSVTAYGRQMIELTKKTVESVAPDAIVIYGDTDSVMIKYGCSVPAGPDGKLVDVEKAIAESRALALEGADAVNKLFPKPINLAYEKVFYPYLLINKKRYSGGYFENPAPVRMFLKSSGIESQRRDNCKLVPRVIDEALACIMDDFAPDRAIATVQDAVAAILRGPQTPETIIEACVEEACHAAGAPTLAAIDAAAASASADPSTGEASASMGSPLTDALADLHKESAATGKMLHDFKKRWMEAAREWARYAGADDEHIEAAATAVEVTLRRYATLEDFVISKAYSRALEEYKDAQPHAEVLKNMQARKAEGDPIAAAYERFLGDRIDYVIVAPCAARPESHEIVETMTMGELKKMGKAKRDKAFVVDASESGGNTVMGVKKIVKRIVDRAEDPEWANANGLVPDAVYYIEKQLLGPCSRLLSPLFSPNKEVGKAKAINRIMDLHKQRVLPECGFAFSRFDPNTRHMIAGTTKRTLSPAQQEEKKRKAWQKQQEKAGTDKPYKAARAAGPLDAFFKPREE